MADRSVYFNPAKTIGAMIEANLFCIFGLVYAWAICGIAIGGFWWLELQIPHKLYWIVDVGVIVLIGAAMSVVAWLRVWMVSH